jgi:hypothetical protein
MGAMFTNAQHTIVCSPPPIECTESRHQLLAEIEDLKRDLKSAQLLKGAAAVSNAQSTVSTAQNRLLQDQLDIVTAERDDFKMQLDEQARVTGCSVTAKGCCSRLGEFVLWTCHCFYTNNKIDAHGFYSQRGSVCVCVRVRVLVCWRRGSCAFGLAVGVQ